MQPIERALEERLAPQGVPLAVVLPGGRRLGSASPAVTLTMAPTKINARRKPV